MKRFVLLSILFLIGQVMLAANHSKEEIQPGDYLPEFVVNSNTEENITSSSLLGKPAVIVFFHTHCYDCRKELPIVQKLYQQYGKHANFICISRAQSEPEVADYWKQHNFTLPYSAQPDKRVFRLFARRTIPRIYLCNAQGKVVKVYVEKVRERKLTRNLRQLLENRNKQS